MQCIETCTVFECTVLSEPVIQLSIQMVSLVSFLLNQPFWTNLNDSVSNLQKQGLVPTYWRFYCHIYLSMTDLKIMQKNAFSKINNNDQNSSTSGPRRKRKKLINNSSFNKANLSLNRNLLKKMTFFTPPPPQTYTHHITSPLKLFYNWTTEYIYTYIFTFLYQIYMYNTKKHVFTFFSYLVTFYIKKIDFWGWF